MTALTYRGVVVELLRLLGVRAISKIWDQVGYTLQSSGRPTRFNLRSLSLVANSALKKGLAIPTQVVRN